MSRDNDKIKHRALIQALEEIIASKGGYLKFEEPIPCCIDDEGETKVVNIRSLVYRVEDLYDSRDGVNCTRSLGAIDTNFELWDVDDYFGAHLSKLVYFTENIESIQYIVEKVKSI